MSFQRMIVFGVATVLGAFGPAAASVPAGVLEACGADQVVAQVRAAVAMSLYLDRGRPKDLSRAALAKAMVVEDIEKGEKDSDTERHCVAKVSLTHENEQVYAREPVSYRVHPSRGDGTAPAVEIVIAGKDLQWGQPPDP